MTLSASSKAVPVMGSLYPVGDGCSIRPASGALPLLLTSGRLPRSVEVGLVIYSDCSAIEWEPFTTDHQEILYWVELAEPSGSTPLAAAIDEAVSRMVSEAAKNGQPGDIVVVSDGKETCGGDPYGAAARGRQQRIPAPDANRTPAEPDAHDARQALGGDAPYGPFPRTVGFLRPGPDVVALQDAGEIRISTIGFDVSEETEQELAGIAQEGGGSYLSANDIDALTAALGEVVRVEAPAEDPPVPEVIPAEELQESPHNPWPWALGAAAAGAIALAAGAIVVRQIRTVPVDELALACDACGFESPPLTRFCLSCGTPLPVFCPGCGTLARAGVRFCRRCGREVGTIPPAR